MTTAQKRGFRFPWGGDPGRDPDPSEHDDDEPSLAERLGTASDDLGRGPFDLRPAEAEPDHQPADEPVDTAPAMANATEDDVATTPTPVATPSAAVAPTDATGPTRAVWPESDRRSGARAAAAATAPEAPAAAARTAKANPLVAGLVRAMRDAARTARDESVSALRAEAATRSDAIRSDGATAVASLRKTADADVAAIREWSKAEIARLREETETRIAARKDQLVTETDNQGRATEATLASLADAVSGYESEATAFFDRLLAEEDPARLAGLAERMPSPPTLEAFGTTAPSEAEAPAKRTASTHPAVASEPVAEATPVVDGEAVADEPETVTDATAEPIAEAEAGAATEAAGLDAESAAEAEAAALAGLDRQTQLIVSGLSSVASIAAFKGAVMQDAGVSAVSVNAGNDGDCVFTVTHAGDADLRVALREMAAFQTRLIADDGSTLVVVVHEAAA